MTPEIASIVVTIITGTSGFAMWYLNQKVNKQKDAVSTASDLSNAAMGLVDRLEKRLDEAEKEINDLKQLLLTKDGEIKQLQFRVDELETANLSLLKENEDLRRRVSESEGA